MRKLNLFILLSLTSVLVYAKTMVSLDGAGWTCDGKPVSVPHTWNAKDACDGPGGTTEPRGGDSAASQTSYLRKRAVYRRPLPPVSLGKRVFLKCEGASQIADVTVNGRAVGRHVGAFTAFVFELTDCLKASSNVLEIAVDNRLSELTQPLSADFSLYGGLYRSVGLIETEAVCIDRVTDAADGVSVFPDPKTGEVEVRIAVLGGTNEVQRFSVRDFELWSPENPRLYTRKVKIHQQGCRDEEEVRFAFRTFEFRADGFYLNGVRRQLRGVNRHQDREGKGWAVSARDEEDDIRQIKELGADALRTAHYPQSRRVYDLCDELGLICWVEYPNVNRLLFTEAFERGMRTQVREMVRQLGNHPSIAMWGIWNELEMDENLEGWRLDPGKTREVMSRTRDLVHSLDPSRPVVAATDKPKSRLVNDVTDQLAYNRYPGWYSQQSMRQMLDEMFAADERKILGMSEYGVGGSVSQHGDPALSVLPEGPWHPEEYQAFRMHDNLLQMMLEPRIWGHYVWAMFDFGADRRTEGDAHGKNDKGIMAFDHKTKKDVYYLYQANWRKDLPILHLVGSRMTSLTNECVTVLGFSNVGDVRLTVNGRDCGVRQPDAASGVLWRDVVLSPGLNKVRLEAGEHIAETCWCREPSRVIYHDGWIDLNKNGVKDVYEDASRPIAERVRDLLSQMTDDEKSCQLATVYGSGRVLKEAQPSESWKREVWKDGIANIDEELNGVGKCYETHYDLIYPFSSHVKALNEIQRWFVEETRLGIPVDFSNEGIHGLNHTKATPLPAPIGIGSTWNKGLVSRAGEIVGREAKYLGYSNVYAPILDVVRDPRWGRTLECYGESPYLIAELGKRMVLGIQSQGVAATLKHYAVYSAPKGGRDADCRTDPHVTPRELHQIFLYPFARVIREAHPMGVMCSYNDWNGEPVAASPYFLTELLRDTYGFDGYVVSDSDAVEFVQTKHQVAATYEDAVHQVVEAGLNVRTNFSPPEQFVMPLRRLLAEGRISREAVDSRVAEVLSVKFRLGLFDRPYGTDPAAADRLVGADKHLTFADDIQDQSLVLLKNEGGLLPLDPTKKQKILVTGPLAAETNYMTSRYGPNGLVPISVLQGVRDRLGSEAEVVYAKGCDTVNPGWPNSEVVPVPPSSAELAAIDEATAVARAADVVIAVLGEDERTTGESRSRTSLDLPGRQQLLLERIQATGKPVVLVLVNGRPLTVTWANAFVPAILETWFPGVRGGRSVARALFGDLNPNGKLTVTFPKTIGQIEYNFPFKKGSHGRQNRLGDPNGDGVTRVVGPLYPFGYGLSYTQFAYSDLKVEPRIGSASESRKIAFTVTNVGKRSGAEVAQLYVRDEVSSVVTYDSVLRGFEKVWLDPGESKVVEMTLKPKDLQILDRMMEWRVEPGDFALMIGASSEDIRLKGGFSVR